MFASACNRLRIPFGAKRVEVLVHSDEVYEVWWVYGVVYGGLWCVGVRCMRNGWCEVCSSGGSQVCMLWRRDRSYMSTLHSKIDEWKNVRIGSEEQSHMSWYGSTRHGNRLVMFMFWGLLYGQDPTRQARRVPPLHPCSFRCIPATLRLAGKCRLRAVTLKELRTQRQANHG